MDYSKVNTLLQEKGNAWEEAKRMVAPYLEKGEDIPADVMESFNRANDAIDAATKSVELAQSIKLRENFLNTIDTSARLPVEVPGQPGNYKELQIAAEVKALNAAIGEGVAAVRRYRPELARKDGMLEATDSTGGYLSQPLYLKQFVDLLYEWSYIRQAGATVIPMTAEIMRVPRMVTAVASAVVLTETAAYSVVTPTVNEVTFTAIKYGHLVKVSDELAADTAFPLAETIILPQMAQAFAAAENTEFTLGDGSGNPEGIVQALTAVSTASVAAGAATVITAVDCINLQHALPVQYRRGRKVAFMANDTIIRDLRLLTDNAGGAASLLSPTHSGNFLWQPGLREGTPDTLLGYPIHPNSSMDASAPAQNEESLIFGDWSFYWIAERGGLEMRFLPELYAGTGQVAWRGTKRVDGRCMQTAAFKVLRHP